MSVEVLGVLILIAGITLPTLLIRMGRSPMSPLVVIWVSQTFPLGIALLNVTNEMPHLRFVTWVVLGSSFLGILAGWLVAAAMGRGAVPFRRVEISRRRLFIAFCVLSVLYLVSIAQGVAGVGGFPLLSSRPDIARSMFMSGRLQNIFFAAGIPMFILAIHLFRISKELWVRLLTASLLALLVVTYLLIGSRFMTLVWLSMILVYWDQSVRRLPLLRLAAILIVFLLVFAVVGYFRYGKFLAASSGASKLYRMGALLAFESIYTYIANAYWNLDHALHLWSTGVLRLPTWGISTNEGILWIAGLLPELQHAYGFSNALNADVMLRSGLNATTYHWGLFKDFELAGPVLGSFAMGWAYTFLHARRCRDAEPGGVMLYGLLTYFLLGSFNLLASVIPTPLFGMLLLWGALRVSERPKTLHAEN